MGANSRIGAVGWLSKQNGQTGHLQVCSERERQGTVGLRRSPSNARPPHAVCIIILLGAGLPVVQITVLPIQPGMSQFMGQNIPATGHRKTFTDIDGLALVVPDPIRIGVTLVHFESESCLTEMR